MPEPLLLELPLELPLLEELPLLPELVLLPELESAELPVELPEVTALEASDVLAPPQPVRKIGTDTRVKFTTAKMKTFFLKILIFSTGIGYASTRQAGNHCIHRQTGLL